MTEKEWMGSIIDDDNDIFLKGSISSWKYRCRKGKRGEYVTEFSWKDLDDILKFIFNNSEFTRNGKFSLFGIFDHTDINNLKSIQSEHLKKDFPLLAEDTYTNMFIPKDQYHNQDLALDCEIGALGNLRILISDHDRNCLQGEDYNEAFIVVTSSETNNKIPVDVYERTPIAFLSPWALGHTWNP